jgi:hypothetical protein
MLYANLIVDVEVLGRSCVDMLYMLEFLVDDEKR